MASATRSGTPDPRQERVRINLPEHYKPVDDEVWSELESYLFQGFLISSAFFYDRTFVFKTLNHHELRLIHYVRPMKASPIGVRDAYRSAFIAHSVLMVDGENVLPGRPRRVSRLSKTVGKMDRGIQDKIMESLAALNERASRLYPLTEVYVHENRSRYRWLHTVGQPVHFPSSTGLSGTDEIGMNHCQQAWTALNRLLDVKEQMERDWTNAKFVGSCFAGKGVRAIDERDKARRERERTELEELKMKVLHAYLNRSASVEGGELVSLPDGRSASVFGRFRADSAEELRDQLEKSLSGEKDHHDLVVDAKMREVRERARMIEDARQRVFRSPEFAAPAVSTLGPSRILGGREAAEAQLARIRALQIQQVERFNRRVPGEEEASDEPGKDGAR